jgi:7,8-dihydropterin-6-yl-methyl-4-(beta-D-ribofuranosyl)aminobenzene 5'-phosphate synthase
MLNAIKLINQAKAQNAEQGNVTVDLHPSRPDYRGFLMGEKIVSLEADPSFEEITSSGATLSLNADTHTVLDDMFLISGEIPRETAYEHGVKFGMRFDKEDGEWFSDEKIADERFLLCNLKGTYLSISTSSTTLQLYNIDTD